MRPIIKQFIAIAYCVIFSAYPQQSFAARSYEGKLPLVLGVSGKTLTEAEKELFTKNRCIVGYILFGRNIENETQLKKLIRELRGLHPKDQILVFMNPSRLYPAAKDFGDRYNHNPIGVKQAVFKYYTALMEELKKLGINSPCAPVADILYKGATAAIGDRSFGENPDKVIALASAAISGIVDRGGIPIIKHMPGHGRAVIDSHVELPHVDVPLATLASTDFKVFKELPQSEHKQKIWGMVAHIVFKSLDASSPATISKKVIDYIKKDIGFSGTIVTDCITMDALHGALGKKRLLLQRAIDQPETSTDWRKEYVDFVKNRFKIDFNTLVSLFKDYFDIDFKTITDTELRAKSRALLAKEINAAFINSLTEKANQALDAGCTIVLHCDGNYDAMKALIHSMSS